ncbi:MBL fold metallo-hydrolase [Mycobacterium sp. M26]|uniref:MBL fold metallo-hydrolase n=1 Tax=Mycobacterium sp. M26 TaxID=1762962 RepID=UPI00073F482F|nr:MBL fold metallo-hydrolase [Mycobacterium sp. M26]
MPGTPVTAATPGVVEAITDTVARVVLPLPLPDLRSVNTYVLHSPSDGVTLVDPGWAFPPAETALIQALDELGYVISDVDRIVVTHQHWDHYSLGVQWRDRHGIELMLGREERHSIESFARLPHEVHPTQVPQLRRAGAVELAAEIDALDWEPFERGVSFDYPDRWLDDGDVIDCGVAAITVRATPGHTRGHVVFEDSARRLIFTGDHLLPRITPSLAFERAPQPMALRSYLDSLQLILELPDARMLPAHGTTDRTTHVRADELLAHHATRLQIIGDLVAAGRPRCIDIAAEMRWTRGELALDALNAVHRMTAVLEVQAHLDLLEFQGWVTGADVDGVRHYQVA